MSSRQEPPGTEVAAADSLNKQGNCKKGRQFHLYTCQQIYSQIFGASDSGVSILTDHQRNGKELVKEIGRGSNKGEQSENYATAFNYKNKKFPLCPPIM